MRRMSSPRALQPLGAKRRLDDAHWTTETTPDRRRQVTVLHPLLHRISPEMLTWWFANIEGDMGYRDQQVDRYQEWHPEDHLLWRVVRPSPGGGYGAGARVRVVEAFGGNPSYYFGLTWDVWRYDSTGTTRAARVLGMTIAERQDDWWSEGKNLRYRSVLRVGAPGVLGRLLNPLIHRLLIPHEAELAWARHSVEEMGFLEWLIVGLYLTERDSSPEAR